MIALPTSTARSTWLRDRLRAGGPNLETRKLAKNGDFMEISWGVYGILPMICGDLLICGD